MHRRRLIFSTQCVLATSIALSTTACESARATPIFLTPVPPAKFDVATPSVSVPEANDTAMTQVDVALTGEQAEVIVLGLLNPAEQPVIESVRLTSAENVEKVYDLIGSRSPEDLGVDNAEPVYVVSVSMHHVMFQGRFPEFVPTRPPSTAIADEFSSEALPMVVVIDAVTTEVLIWGYPRLADDIATTTLLRPYDEVRVSLSPPPSRYVVPPTKTPEAKHFPDGAEFRMSRLLPDVQSVLHDYPLVPGNSWTYQEDAYEHLLWSGTIVTESVEVASVLSPNTYVAEVKTITSAHPQSRGGDHVHDTWLWFVSPDTVYTERAYVMVHKNELFRARSLSELYQWLDYLDTHNPIPTMASVYEFLSTQGDRPVPLLRFPIAMGFLAPMPDVGGDWTIERRVPVHTPAGIFDGCAEAYHPGNASEWFWFCEGMGVAWKEFEKGGSAGVRARTRLIRSEVAP